MIDAIVCQNYNGNFIKMMWVKKKKKEKKQKHHKIETLANKQDKLQQMIFLI